MTSNERTSILMFAFPRDMENILKFEYSAMCKKVYVHKLHRYSVSRAINRFIEIRTYTYVNS